MADRRKAPLSLPRLLDSTGLVHDEMTPESFQQSSQRSNETLPIPEGSLQELGHLLASILGLTPNKDEKIGSYWGREFPSTAPSLQEPLGQDINLPPDPKVKLRKK